MWASEGDAGSAWRTVYAGAGSEPWWVRKRSRWCFEPVLDGRRKKAGKFSSSILLRLREIGSNESERQYQKMVNVGRVLVPKYETVPEATDAGLAQVTRRQRRGW